MVGGSHQEPLRAGVGNRCDGAFGCRLPSQTSDGITASMMPARASCTTAVRRLPTSGEDAIDGIAVYAGNAAGRPDSQHHYRHLNGLGYLESCLRSVCSESGATDEVVVVDNNSVDGSSDFVHEHFPDVRVLQNRTNIRNAAACNQAAKAATGQFLVFLNQDTVVLPGWRDGLIVRELAAEREGRTGDFARAADASPRSASIFAGRTCTTRGWYSGAGMRNAGQ